MREILEAVKQWIIRFFDSRSVAFEQQCDEIAWLRTQIQIKDHQIQLLTAKISETPAAPVTREVDDEELPKPIVPENIPWAQRKAMLQRADRERFQAMRKEMQAEVKSTEQLESELLTNNGN